MTKKPISNVGASVRQRHRCFERDGNRMRRYARFIHVIESCSTVGIEHAADVVFYNAIQIGLALEQLIQTSTAGEIETFP